MDQRRLIAHVDLDSFFVAVERELDPSLIGLPLVVGGSPKARGVVASASYEAREFGIRSGMAMSTALKKLPTLKRVPGRRGVYRDYSDRVMAVLARFADRIDQVGIDEAYLDLTKTQPLFKLAPTELGAKIREETLRATNLSVSIGIGSSRVSAKIASKLAKPAGILYLRAEEEFDFIGSLPIEKMPGVGGASAAKLRQSKIFSIADARAAGVEKMEKLFGRYGARLYERANLIEPDKFAERRQPPKSTGREVTFPTDLTDMGLIESALSYLSEKVASAALADGRAFDQITVKARRDDFESASRSKILPERSSDHSTIYKNGAPILTALIKKRARPTRLIGVAVRFAKSDSEQLPLFRRRLAREELIARTVEIIRAQFGFDSIIRARSLEYAKTKTESID